MDNLKLRKRFSIRLGITGIIATALAFGLFVVLLPEEHNETLALVSFLMFGAPFLLSSTIAALTHRPNIFALRGMAIGLLSISIMIVLYSAITLLLHNDGGANIGALAVLAFAPLYYCVGGYLGWRSGGLFYYES